MKQSLREAMGLGADVSTATVEARFDGAVVVFPDGSEYNMETDLISDLMSAQGIDEVAASDLVAEEDPIALSMLTDRLTELCSQKGVTEVSDPESGRLGLIPVAEFLSTLSGIAMLPDNDGDDEETRTQERARRVWDELKRQGLVTKALDKFFALYPGQDGGPALNATMKLLTPTVKKLATTDERDDITRIIKRWLNTARFKDARWSRD